MAKTTPKRNSSSYWRRIGVLTHIFFAHSHWIARLIVCDQFARLKIKKVADEETIVVVPLIVRMILVDVQLALRAVAVEDRVPELNMCDEPSNALPTEFSTGLYFIWDLNPPVYRTKYLYF